VFPAVHMGVGSMGSLREDSLSGCTRSCRSGLRGRTSILRRSCTRRFEALQGSYKGSYRRRIVER
jgi:hypothetical protein